MSSIGLERLDRSTTVPSLQRPDLESAPLYLAPAAEQERIVAAIEEQFSRLDAGEAALKRVLLNLKRMRAAVLRAAVTGQLTQREPSDAPAAELLHSILSDRTVYLAHHPYAGSKRVPAKPDPGELPPIPDGWTWATVDQLCTRVVDGVHKKPTYVQEGVPFVTVRNLTAGPGISFDHLNYITQEDHVEFCRRTRPEYGDLLISKDGTLGAVRAVRDRREFNIFVSVALMKPVLRELSDYLEIALASPVVQGQMVPKGSGLQHIHLEDLRRDCVPIPPLREQKNIVDEVHRQLSVIDGLGRIVDMQMKRTGSLRSAILASAFAGQLVDQDSSDEPASVLLDRIATERNSSNYRTSKITRNSLAEVTA
jgi:type I restriction enzyme S subunit